LIEVDDFGVVVRGCRGELESVDKQRSVFDEDFVAARHNGVASEDATQMAQRVR
jgi:hypothetical protein